MFLMKKNGYLANYERMNLYFLFGSFAFMASFLSAVVPDPIPCVMDLETHFFSPQIVNQALSFYHVREELWPLINKELEEKNKEVPRLMIKWTANMVPNPIEYPMQKLQTAEVLKKVLFSLFQEILAKYYVDRVGVTAPAFNYIFEQQKDRFIFCFGEEVQKMFTNVNE